MIAFDSNVLIRHYLTDPDEPHQSEKARALVKTALSKGNSIYLSQIVLCEAVWVLERCYRLPRKSLTEFLNSVLHDPPFVVESPEEVTQALRQFSQTKADFADCLISANAKAQGVRKIYTFDREAKTVSGMEVLK